ncbi:hypothetical protein M406DRAFT_75838 [Cryphonectria parasitica EP155]|uniref:Uncharacterized protein n=1 Tax=Cryphonectria parasitica (strain ATCC 38755 / EP155) TaxID=660469 RepID=A0A9P4Y9B8_CRYP1|nr:uncharacterized protein M406DRAFT_75838 [Cryphonectria parasitica EP155]KAF3769357.1 hypothetical protein M406DRAFT_75838 [Cryphonectria parasitica EP155]
MTTILAVTASFCLPKIPSISKRPLAAMCAPSSDNIRTPLDQSVIEHKKFLDEWLDTAHEVGQTVLAGQLELSIVCDTVDTQTAKLAAGGLAYFPDRDGDMGKIAEAAALKATGRAPRAIAAFRFMDLPTELRMLILSYTDLVIPLKEVQWHPTRKYHLKNRQKRCDRFSYGVRSYPCPDSGQDWIPMSRDRWPGAQNCPCDNGYFHYACIFRNCWQHTGQGDCSCQRRHTAYSTNTDGCRCWTPPSGLFLVGRHFYRDAQSIFFNQNRVIVMPHSGVEMNDPPTGQHPAHYSASLFLRSGLVTASLQYIGFLDIVFPPIDREPAPDDPDLVDWFETLRWAKDLLDLPRLTLRFEIAEHGHACWAPESRQKLNGDAYKAIVKGCFAFLRPLGFFRGTSSDHLKAGQQAAASDGLRRLFIHVAAPAYCRTELNYWAKYGVPDDLNQAAVAWRETRRKEWKKFSMEEKFERSIMGSNYDSQKAGKGEVKLPEWKWEHLMCEDRYY